MRRCLLPILLGGVALQIHSQAYAAVACTPAETQWVRAPITRDTAAKHYKVRVACNLKLDPSDIVQKRIILEGPEASGVTIDCNSATLDGGKGTPNDGSDMIEVMSRLDGAVWKRPTDITIRNCNVNGSMRIRGMGSNGEADAVRDSSHDRVNHIPRLRAAAPTRITLDNLTITSTARTPLYLAPGVTEVTFTNSELKGDATRTALYLDAESAYNTIRNNYIHVTIFDEWFGTVNRLGPQISVDTSSYNKIINNRFAALEGGGIYTFRNCGEGGTVRHGSSSHNQIINNVFYYNKYDGDNPSILLGSRGQWYRSLGIGNCDETTHSTGAQPPAMTIIRGTTSSCRIRSTNCRPTRRSGKATPRIVRT
jgi:hypothetical protein